MIRKSISRRTFRQLIHRLFGHNFLDFFVAMLGLNEGVENGEKTRNFYGGTPRWKRLRERICW